MNRANPIVDFAAKGYESRGKRIFAPMVGEAPSLVAGSSRNLLSPTALEELFLYQRTANGAGGTGAAVFQSIKGNSIVWNQQINAETSTFNECTITKNANGTYTVSGVGTVARYKTMSPNQFGAIGHKLLYRFHIISGSGVAVYDAGNLTPSGGYISADKEMIYTQSALSTWTLIRAANATDDGTFSLEVFDLTQIFGAGYEPASVAAFNALYPLISSAYNPGAIKNNCATGMVTDGLNQWDEVWEDGDINTSTGADEADTTRWRSSYIHLVAGQNYYYKAPASTVYARHFFYDANTNFISSYSTSSYLNNVISIPSGAAYMRFVIVKSAYGSATYKNDICVNLSGPRNGQYEPHWSDTCALPITTATGKLNGEGESVVITPNGMGGVGSSFDEGVVEKGKWTKDIIRRARVDLGGEDTDWIRYEGFTNPIFYSNAVKSKAKKSINALCSKYICVDDYPNNMPDKSFCMHYGGANLTQIYIRDDSYSDAATFKAAMDGVMLDYELATEQLYVLDTPVPVVARVDEDGTQTITPQGVDESGTPMTAPFAASIFYPEQMDKVYLTAADFKNFLDAAVSGGAITAYTMEWNAATGSYDFTVNQAAATLAAPASTE